MKRRSVNAPLAYLMGGIRTVGFEGWVGFFFPCSLLTNIAFLALPLMGKS